MRRLLNLVRDERGGSVIELALVAPLLASLVVGMIDISSGYSQKLILQQAAQRTIERVMQAERAKEAKDDTGFYDTLVDEAALAAGVPKTQVQVKYWLECNGVSQNTSPATMTPDYEKTCSPGVYFARYVTVRIQKSYKPMIKAKLLGANPDGTFTLSAESGIRVQ